MGVFGLNGDKFIAAGFNQWRETNGKMEIGKMTPMDDMNLEGTDLKFKSMMPRGILHTTPQESDELIKKNMRAILRLFDIRVTVLPGRLEIRGIIPPQVIDIPAPKPKDASNIGSVRRLG